jgi:hypothetical protein
VRKTTRQIGSNRVYDAMLARLLPQLIARPKLPGFFLTALSRPSTRITSTNSSVLARHQERTAETSGESAASRSLRSQRVHARRRILHQGHPLRRRWLSRASQISRKEASLDSEEQEKRAVHSHTGLAKCHSLARKDTHPPASQRRPHKNSASHHQHPASRNGDGSIVVCPTLHPLADPRSS